MKRATPPQPDAAPDSSTQGDRPASGEPGAPSWPTPVKDATQAEYDAAAPRLLKGGAVSALTHLAIALAMAAEIDNPFTSATAKSNCAKPHADAMDALRALETEVESKAEAELDAHVAALPFKVLLPLLLFQFPAYLLLLLGPLLRELQRQLGG